MSVYGGRLLALQLGRDDRQNKLTLEICWGYVPVKQKNYSRIIRKQLTGADCTIEQQS
jgi:hypothetical protein